MARTWTRIGEALALPPFEEFQKLMARRREEMAAEIAALSTEYSSGTFQLETCAVCGGAGRVRHEVPIDHADFGKTFVCPACGPTPEALAAQRAAKLTAKSGLMANQREQTFSNFELYEGNQRAYRNAREFALMGLEKRMWLTISGTHGTGKTHLASAIANELIARGEAVIYFVVADLLEHFREGYKPHADDDDEREFGSFSERFDEIKTCRLLILDDLGMQRSTPWAVEMLERLINYRAGEGLPLVVTTNLNQQTIGDFSARIRDRLDRYHPGGWVTNTAKPYHIKKREEQAIPPELLPEMGV